MWMFLSALIYAAPAEVAAPAAMPRAIWAQDGETYLLILRHGETWDVIFKLDRDYHPERRLVGIADLDGDGSDEYIIYNEIDGQGQPSITVITCRNNTCSTIKDEIIIINNYELVKLPTKNIIRIHSDLPGRYTDYTLSGAAFTEIPHQPTLAPVPAITTPPWLRGGYGPPPAMCRGFGFTIEDSQIVYDQIFPSLGRAFITNIAINADTILITTNLPAPWTVMRMRDGELPGAQDAEEFQTILIDWAASPTGTFDHECSVIGGNIPGW